MSIQLGILLALLCALTTNLGFLLKHRGACAAPDVAMRHPLRSAIGLYRSKWFAIGMLVALGAWILHVAALALAPLSLVQAVISGGLVFLTVLADRVFGFKIGNRQWVGVGLTALGLTLIAVTIPTDGGAHSGYSLAGMIAFEFGLLTVGALLVLSPRLGASHHHHGVLLGMAAGVLFGVSDVAIKALTGSVGAEGLVAGLASPWLLTCLLASIVAFYASARGLQQGEAVPVITMTSAAANVSAITGGFVVFGDPMPGDALGIAVQSLAFVLVIVAARLTPAPVRAAEARHKPAAATAAATIPRRMPSINQLVSKGRKPPQEEGRHPGSEVRSGAQEAQRCSPAARRVHPRLHRHPQEAELRAAQGRARPAHQRDGGHLLHPGRGPQPSGALRGAGPRRPRQGPAGRALQGRARHARRRRRE